MSKLVSDVEKIYCAYGLSKNNYQNIGKKTEVENTYQKWDFISQVVELQKQNKEIDCSIRKGK